MVNVVSLDRYYLYICHESFGSSMKVLAYSPGEEEPAKILSIDLEAEGELCMAVERTC